jgi:hypothetical protein
MVNFKHHPLCPRGKHSKYPLCKEMGGLQEWSGYFREEKDLLPLLGIKLWILSRPGLSLVAVHTVLSSDFFNPAQKYKFPPQTHNSALIPALSSPVPLLASDTNIYAAGRPFCGQRHCQRYGLTVGKDRKRIENAKNSKYRCRQITVDCKVGSQTLRQFDILFKLPFSLCATISATLPCESTSACQINRRRWVLNSPKGHCPKRPFRTSFSFGCWRSHAPPVLLP